MNLIEQLGYEYAKEIYLSNLEDFSGNASGATISTEKLRFTHEELEKALLECRRQHNIFEVGDWVYPLIRIIDEIEGVGRYVCTEKGEIVVVRDVRNKGAFCSHEHRLDNSFYMAFSEFRHATQSEIEAGKRLEVV